MAFRPKLTVALACLLHHGNASCQSVAGPPIRELALPTTVSTVTFSAKTTIRALANGRLLVNDGTPRRVVLLDSTLLNATIVLDSTTAHAYGRQAGALYRYLGDSSPFMDIGSSTALILGPSGQLVRTAAGIGGIGGLSASLLTADRFYEGFPDVDGSGRIVLVAPAPTGRGAAVANAGRDSAHLARWDLGLHRLVDTIATLHTPKGSMLVPPARAGGAPTRRTVVDPLPFMDGWAVLSDGGIAVVRARDYHIDWIGSDGTRLSTPRLPFAWQRLSDDDKRHLVDSATAFEASHVMVNYCVAMIDWVNTYRQSYPPDFKIPRNVDIPNGRVLKGSVLPAGFALPAGYQFRAGMIPSVAAPVPPAPRPGEPFAVLSTDQVEDYWPAFVSTGVRADGDGHVWVQMRPRSSLGDGAIYDVVDRTGVIDRIRLRSDQTLLGFGPGGLVYVLVGKAPALRLATIRWR